MTTTRESALRRGKQRRHGGREYRRRGGSARCAAGTLILERPGGWEARRRRRRGRVPRGAPRTGRGPVAAARRSRWPRRFVPRSRASLVFTRSPRLGGRSSQPASLRTIVRQGHEWWRLATTMLLTRELAPSRHDGRAILFRGIPLECGPDGPGRRSSTSRPTHRLDGASALIEATEWESERAAAARAFVGALACSSCAARASSTDAERRSARALGSSIVATLAWGSSRARRIDNTAKPRVSRGGRASGALSCRRRRARAGPAALRAPRRAGAVGLLLVSVVETVRRLPQWRGSAR